MTTIPIGDSLLNFRAPRHKPAQRFEEQIRIYGNPLMHGLSKTYSEGVMANDCWGFRPLFSRTWSFWGPWMTGVKAELRMYAGLVGRYDKYAYNESSFFHPGAFENVLANYLNDHYGHRAWPDGRPRYRGPVNWARRAGFAPFGASFEIYRLDSDTTKPPTLDEQMFCFPVTSDRFVEIAFEKRLFRKKNWNQPAFDITPVDALQASIFNSIQLELGPKAQAEWEAVKTQCPEMQLSETFPPLRWPVSTDTTSIAEESPALSDKAPDADRTLLFDSRP